MAFDGMTVAALTLELRQTLVGGRIYKIAQPEADALLLTVKNRGQQYRLLLSASASLPLAYLTETNRPGPLTAPNFCMLLRKHLQNGRIAQIAQPGLERVIHFSIEHVTELGDPCVRTLTIELMGKHSNLIFQEEDGRIIDSIKHVSGMVSSVREVLPGRTYFIPRTEEKAELFSASRETLSGLFAPPAPAAALPLSKALYHSLTGFSPAFAQEVCYRAGLDADRTGASCTPQERDALTDVLLALQSDVREGRFSPCIAWEHGAPAEFSVLPMTRYEDGQLCRFNSVSAMLEQYYAEKEAHTRIRQKSADLRRIVQTALERSVKKYELQQKQMRDTEKREQYRVYGELLNAYGYQLAPGADCLEAVNYYTGQPVRVPLDPALSASENAKRYFDRYGKLKRTYEALSGLTQESLAQIRHLESVASSLDIAQQEADLAQIREELIESGYLKRKGGKAARKERVVSRPLHYRSSDGFDIYVGKNNFQNDELTFRFADGGDWWFHAKKLPGSHVIVKSGGRELPDRTFEEAGRLAAYYSKGREQEKVEIDYVERKHVKKPGGAKPGFVVYYTNYSLVIDADISGLTLISS